MFKKDQKVPCVFGDGQSAIVPKESESDHIDSIEAGTFNNIIRTMKLRESQKKNVENEHDSLNMIKEESTYKSPMHRAEVPMKKNSTLFAGAS